MLCFTQPSYSPMMFMYCQSHFPEEKRRLRKLTLVALTQPTETMLFSYNISHSQKDFSHQHLLTTTGILHNMQPDPWGFCTFSSSSSCPKRKQYWQDHLNRRCQYLASRLFTVLGISRKEAASYLQALPLNSPYLLVLWEGDGVEEKLQKLFIRISLLTNTIPSTTKTLTPCIALAYLNHCILSEIYLLSKT